MSPLRLFLIAPLVLAAPALAQGTTQQGATTQPQTTTRPQTGTAGGSRYPVATQPSNHPFHNPIDQGVPPAASANSNLNSNRTSVPLAR
jgi:hypothetical protein